LREAGSRAHSQIDEVPAQDVVAGVAAVVAELDVDVVTPGLAESGAVEVLRTIPALDAQVLELSPGGVVGRVAGCNRASRRCRGRGPAPDVADVQPTDASGYHEDDEQGQRAPGAGRPGGNDTRHIAVLALETVEC
jgi:hypothetical protein